MSHFENIYFFVFFDHLTVQFNHLARVLYRFYSANLLT